MRDWKVSELESVRMHFSSKLGSVRIGKCQNWKVSELESVRIIWNLKTPYKLAK